MNIIVIKNKSTMASVYHLGIQALSNAGVLLYLAHVCEYGYFISHAVLNANRAA